MKHCVLWINFLIGFLGYSQVTVSGVLTNELGQAISGVSVVINEKGTDNIIAYDISDSKGKFAITFSSSGNEVDLVVRSMNYANLTQTIANKTQTLNFQLEEEYKQLDEVIAKSAPITKRGDTINYNVESFAKEQDRTIADVLKRMPGMEVLADGKVLYQGKPINKYYIEGLDLLEGKYNLANENLPYKEVSKVQVLENHQPIKLLDSLQFSDNAALNIKLKNAYTFTGQAKIGTGLANPFLWEVNATPIVLTKKQQLLVSYQSNNIGDNVGKQLNILTLEDLLNQFENGAGKEDWLSIQPLYNPNFSEKRWLNNNVNLLTGNYLHKLKKDYELRLNVSYLNDYQQQRGSTQTQFFTPTQTIDLLETKYNQLYFNNLDANLTLQKNTQKNYLKNSLQYQGNWDGQRGSIMSNQAPLTQNLSNPYFNISNQLKTLFPLGKQIMTLNSYIGFNKTPQTLSVNPGPFQALLNNGMAYEEVAQKVHLNSFYTNNSIEFTKGWKHISLNPKMGFQIQKQNLESAITTSQSQNLGGDFQNNLDWLQSKIYFDVQTQYRKDKWRIELMTPINFNTFKVKDPALQEGQNLNKLTFEPRVNITYEANAFWRLSTSGGLNNKFGAINQLHYAYILKNYRNIQRINTPLPQTFNQSISGGISYRNPIKSWFGNMIYSQIRSNNNLLYQTEILESGAKELQAIQQDNQRITHNVSTRLSKYLSKLKTNVTLNANLGKQNFQQILNDEITAIQNTNWGMGAKIEIDFTDWFNTEYQGNWTFSKNKIQDQSNHTIIQQNHLLNLNFYPKENHYIAIKSEYIQNNFYTNTTQNVFADFIYRYTWKKKNLDFEIQWSNIFNTKNYRTVNVDAYSYIETNYLLRPSQVLFKARFSL